ncbi:kinesin-like protein Klp5 [Boothiomyces macroporosus]|uniref:Kinesin-like protein n=1 Tax=Boothiomyces macroporosus TaxID=261099 RepID=A0AAD5Y3P2_9FUNG|nr:kinesin-like protein Klp5 [Boothiomyces macroporosus]
MENITVAVRVRPLLETEKIQKKDRRQSFLVNAEESDRTIHILDSNILSFDPHKKPQDKKQYAFDKVFDDSASQRQVFEGTAKPLIDHVLSGYNSTVFAYGATGCGKTHTITGTEQDPGIIYQTIKELYEKLEAIKENNLVEVTMSYLEVYNETIRDLFSKSSNTLEIREDSSKIVVAGLSELNTTSLEKVMKLLLVGNENRTKAFTMANSASSRSHAVLQINVKQKPKFGDTIKLATLSIIDLAGSERASATQNKGERLLEGANINRSLLALGNCINALCSDKPAHVPYRNSKLTRLLKYSLSGNCKVVMIANVSPAIAHSEETLNTLKYANRAKDIKTKVSQNTIEVSTQLSQYPKIIEELRAEILRLQSAIPENEEYCERAVEKARLLNEKIKLKQQEYYNYQTEMAINEEQVENIKCLLLSFANGLQLDQLKKMNDTILQLNEKMDELLNQNNNLYHNSAQCQIALERYSNSLNKLTNKYQDSSRVKIKMYEYMIDRESFVIQLQRELFTKQQETCRNEIAKLVKLNLDFFGKLLVDPTASVESLLFPYIHVSSNTVEPVLDYDTTEAESEADTDTESNIFLQVSKLKVEENRDLLSTPKKRIESDDELQTPMQRKKVKKTPRTLKKTPKRKRMSMIPIMRSSRKSFDN